MLRSHVIPLVALLSGVGLLQSASLAQAASLVIDDFSNPAFTRISTLGPDRITNTNLGTSSFLGDRDRRVVTDGSTVTSTQIGFLGTDRIAGSTTGTGQRYLLTYDGATDSTGEDDALTGAFGSFGPIDLTTDGNGGVLTGLRLNFVNAFTPGNLNIDIRANSGSGDFTLESAPNPSNNSTTYEVSYSAFTGVDFSSLNALVFQFDNLTGTSIELDSIEAFGPEIGPGGGTLPPSVPEPTTVLGSLLVLGFGSTLKSRHRRKTA